MVKDNKQPKSVKSSANDFKLSSISSSSAVVDSKKISNGLLTVMSEQQYKLLAEFVSTATNPAVVFVISLAFITSRYAQTTEEFLSWTAIGTLLLVGPGAIYTFLIWRKDKKIDIDITKREDRVVPLMLASLGALFGGYLISSRLDNESLFLVSNILVAMLVALTILTSQWKVSLHTATYAALTTLLLIFTNWYFALLYLGLFVIGWARLYLKQHTLPQLVGGSLIGVAITTVIFLLFRS